MPLAATESTVRLESATITVKSVLAAVVSDSASSKVSTISVPSVEVSALDNVGRIPSTLCADWLPAASWSRLAPTDEPVTVTAPPDFVSAFSP